MLAITSIWKDVVYNFLLTLRSVMNKYAIISTRVHIVYFISQRTEKEKR